MFDDHSLVLGLHNIIKTVSLNERTRLNALGISWSDHHESLNTGLILVSSEDTIHHQCQDLPRRFTPLIKIMFRKQNILWYPWDYSLFKIRGGSIQVVLHRGPRCHVTVLYVLVIFASRNLTFCYIFGHISPKYCPIFTNEKRPGSLERPL